MSKLKLSAQEGRALALTLIILAIGCLLIPPFLAYISTNLFASYATEEGMKEQYAADAGVEYAIRRIKDGECPEGTPFDTPTLVNGMPVTVTVGTESEGVYKVITSTATNVVDGSSTTIVSYVSLNTLDFTWLFDSAITSPNEVTLQPNTEVSGTITCPLDPGQNWPETDDLSNFYFEQVEGLDPYPDDIIDVASGTEADPYLIGPLYYVGDLLQIQSSTADATAVLTGTIYVAGDLNIGGPKEFTLDLNGQTIYVEGDIDIGGKCTITGSGIIIAEGDVVFAPSIESNPDDFVFVMSIEGTLFMLPLNDFFGSLAGDVEVQLQPGSSVTWTDWSDEGLNWLDGSSGDLEIRTYSINP